MPAFSPKMFPHPVVIHRAAYPKGQVGGPTRADASTTSLNANVQSGGMDKTMRVDADESGSAVGSLATYDASFPSDPAVAVDDSITWQGPPLQVQAPATLIARFGLWRVRCIVRS
jgi:hypothetical protein